MNPPQENIILKCLESSSWNFRSAKALCCWGSAPDSAGGAYSAPRSPAGERLAAYGPRAVA